MAVTEKKMLFFDIDGTLITDDGRRLLPDSTRTAIKMARDKGHMTFINTGRVLINVEEFIRSPGFDGYVCGCGTYINVDGNELLHHKISHDRCYEIAIKARECGMMSIFEYAFHTAYDKEMPQDGNKEILDYFKQMGRKMIDDIESSDFVFDKFTTWYNDGNIRVDEFIEYLSDDFHCIKREGNFYEIVPKGYSKATGIRFLQDYYNIPLDNIYVFGDSNNDLDMLRYASNSIAMGVCTPEVAKVATYRTDTVENDGIMKAMKHLGVI